MHWESLLNDAAQRFDGGSCSFPLATKVPLYDPPNEEYERLFFDQARSSQASNRCSAGWILPDDRSVCNPVFVANSLLAAIWLVRATLPNNTLPDNTWACLAYAANKLSQHQSSPPPSAQESSHLPLPGREALVPPTSGQRRRLSPNLPSSAGSKRAGAPQSPDLPKRTRTTEPASQVELSSPVESPQASKASAIQDPIQPEQMITTVTNHNRRADQARTKKLEALRRSRLGLVPPANGAPLPERNAYTSISREQEASIAWIIKQRISSNEVFYQATKMPYHTALDFLGKAHALGSINARFYARQFLQAWRVRGTLFYSREDVHNSLDSQLPTIQSPDVDFRIAWERCRRYEGVLAVVQIKYRWAEAILGRAYANKIAQIQQSDFVSSSDTTRNRYGKGKVRSEAISVLLQLVNPRATSKEKGAFRKRLARATRWYQIANSLGWGILTLMPYENFPNTWLERNIHAWGVSLWIELVKKECPDVCAAAKALENWLGPEGIAGGYISSKETLYLESDIPTNSIVEIEDSEDESSDESCTPTQLQTTPLASVSIKGIRQMSLLELFKPLEQG